MNKNERPVPDDDWLICVLTNIGLIAFFMFLLLGV